MVADSVHNKVKLASLFVAFILIIIFLAECLGPISNGDWIFYTYQVDIFPENQTSPFL
jgi:hypothetical protein